MFNLIGWFTVLYLALGFAGKKGLVGFNVGYEIAGYEAGIVVDEEGCELTWERA